MLLYNAEIAPPPAWLRIRAIEEVWLSRLVCDRRLGVIVWPNARVSVSGTGSLMGVRGGWAFGRVIRSWQTDKHHRQADRHWLSSWPAVSTMETRQVLVGTGRNPFLHSYLQRPPPKHTLRPVLTEHNSAAFILPPQTPAMYPFPPHRSHCCTIPFVNHMLVYNNVTHCYIFNPNIHSKILYIHTEPWMYL